MSDILITISLRDISPQKYIRYKGTWMFVRKVVGTSFEAIGRERSKRVPCLQSSTDHAYKPTVPSKFCQPLKHPRLGIVHGGKEGLYGATPAGAKKKKRKHTLCVKEKHCQGWNKSLHHTKIRAEEILATNTFFRSSISIVSYKASTACSLG